MRGKIVLGIVALGLAAMAAAAQQKSSPLLANTIYCSGIVSTQSPRRSTYVVTGQGSDYRLTWINGDRVYLSRGARNGVKVGDRFQIVRPVVDTIQIGWTKWQDLILRHMGTVWEDEGQAQVIAVEPKSSVAQVENACNYVQRGDIAVPFQDRPLPTLKSEKDFNPLTPIDGHRKLAMVIASRDFHQQHGTNDVVYVNLGQRQGVRVGDYFKMFRYTGTQHEIVFQDPRYAFDANGGSGLPTIGYAGYAGFGSAPLKWNWSNTPREVLGEGVVLRTAKNSSTVLITLSLKEIYSGDYVVLE